MDKILYLYFDEDGITYKSINIRNNNRSKFNIIDLLEYIKKIKPIYIIIYTINSICKGDNHLPHLLGLLIDYTLIKKKKSTKIFNYNYNCSTKSRCRIYINKEFNSNSLNNRIKKLGITSNSNSNSNLNSIITNSINITPIKYITISKLSKDYTELINNIKNIRNINRYGIFTFKLNNNFFINCNFPINISHELLLKYIIKNLKLSEEYNSGTNNILGGVCNVPQTIFDNLLHFSAVETPKETLHFRTFPRFINKSNFGLSPEHISIGGLPINNLSNLFSQFTPITINKPSNNFKAVKKDYIYRLIEIFYRNIFIHKLSINYSNLLKENNSSIFLFIIMVLYKYGITQNNLNDILRKLNNNGITKISIKNYIINNKFVVLYLLQSIKLYLNENFNNISEKYKEVFKNKHIILINKNNKSTINYEKINNIPPEYINKILKGNKYENNTHISKQNIINHQTTLFRNNNKSLSIIEYYYQLLNLFDIAITVNDENMYGFLLSSKNTNIDIEQLILNRCYSTLISYPLTNK